MAQGTKYTHVTVGDLFAADLGKGRRQIEAIGLLGLAASALEDEVAAAGGDDHPVIQEHGRIARRIRRFLAGGRVR